MRQDTQLWQRTNERVLALLNDLDPYGLEPGAPDGFPLDEYDLESAPIASHLIEHGVIDLEKVDEIWHHWFSETLTEAVGPAAAARFIASLNASGSPDALLGDSP